MISKSSKLKTLGLMAAVLTLGACAAGSDVANSPIQRKFQWFSFMEGGDFKAACTPGSAGRYRMVYNGIYTEQVRVYDLNAETGVLDTQLIEPMDLRDFSVSDLAGVLDPWRGKTSMRLLSRAEVSSIVGALESDGAFGPPAVGVQLPSMGFFWTIASCHDGAYHFTGLAWPSAAWDRARFDDALWAVDPIATAVNPPRKTDLRRNPKAGQRYN
ncbi:MAG TPA: hypothetical protein VIN57_07145, partial [Magnetovibrio sp.]